MVKMSKINLAGYTFDGHHSDGANWKQVPAVYAPLDGPSGDPVDVGETDNLKERLENHERRPCWENHAIRGLYFVVRVEESETRRKVIEKAVRDYYDPPCGDK